MINAQADTVIQEQLIEKYMLLPNQVWDDIISQASKVCYNLFVNFYVYVYYVNNFFFSFLPLECGCLEGPRGREATRQHLKNKC